MTTFSTGTDPALAVASRTAWTTAAVSAGRGNEDDDDGVDLPDAATSSTVLL